MLKNSTYCFFWPDNPSRCKTIVILQYLFSSISFICLLCLLAMIIMFKLYRLFAQRLILYLCCCSLVNTALFFVHVDKISPGSCIFQGFLNQFMSWTELLWVCVVTGNIFLVMHGYQLQKYEKKVHLFVWLTSLFWSIIPFFGHFYGQAGSWCWIKREHTGVRFGVWYVPLMLVIFVMLVMCFYMICCSSSYEQEYTYTDGGSFFEQQQSRSRHQSEIRPLIAYPIIYFILNLPMLIYRIDDAVHPNDVPDYTLMVLSVIASPLLGTFNAFAFCIIEDTLKDSCSTAALRNILCCTGETTRIVHNYEVVDGES